MTPTLAIPISIIGASPRYTRRFHHHILTLLALVLAIGLVVDDAIAFWRTYRHMEMGKSRGQAGFWVPLATFSVSVGGFFNEFGVSLAVAILISGFVALTLTPMLCSRMLTASTATHGAETRSFDAFFEWLNRNYGHTLGFAMRGRS